ncbi:MULTISPECIES: restriction endonuclease [unclassified Pseudomonas]|uniref:restriction endonuclease n=1 Tax=unclassified Pseudomonas TaxID=196821 RepID=UPI0007566746|nr:MULTISPECIES: restriction endonuclease [unclassified Pseudomonas]KVV03109.1 Restriction endonuclease [Pseudomonas sp. TAD18]KVV05471.1 Restriction endonuclease [Pseudomonas sp. TAA207]
MISSGTRQQSIPITHEWKLLPSENAQKLGDRGALSEYSAPTNDWNAKQPIDGTKEVPVKPNWYQFQEDICSYFRSIGASAETNATVQGVRTSHDVDVLIKTKYLGEDLVWIVEAKQWKSRVNKLQVLALRTIAEDIGVDRAFIISEAGFQSGAYEAAENTNVKLKTYEELKTDTRHLVESEIIKTYKKRLELIETRYWSHSKSIRKKYGLRGEIWDFPVNFSGMTLLQTAQDAIFAAEANEYPINLETFLAEKQGDLTATNFQQLVNWLNLNLNFIDEKILVAEIEMLKHGDFKPNLRLRDHAATSSLKMYAAAIKMSREE